MTRPEVIHIGDVVKPHGIKGELSVAYYADAPFLLDELGEVLLQAGQAEPEPFRVRSWRMHHGRMLLRLHGVEDRNRAEELRGRRLLAHAEDMPPPDEDEVYLHQIEGFRVVLEDGAELGRIEGFLTPTEEQEIWVIRTPDGRELLLPAHEESVVEVDMDAGVATVAPPPGLLELYE